MFCFDSHTSLSPHDSCATEDTIEAGYTNTNVLEHFDSEETDFDNENCHI